MARNDARPHRIAGRRRRRVRAGARRGFCGGGRMAQEAMAMRQSALRSLTRRPDLPALMRQALPDLLSVWTW